ncbi:UBX domain-containing protein 2A-like isoform X2 [Xyrauchen texanus]|uniref:UBX domain-containing protein 2A-like isoform X2 n=1 Tax=Xyrauchen texanus TaxID=154827 RepID=UPI00224219BE|nr:UBX domain-containing protein 2A-like isoform X2 [Xyrauchen texanus]
MMKDIDSRERVQDGTWCAGAQNDEEEEDEEASPIRASFSIEDLLDEVEKISSVASSSKKVEIVVRLWKNGFTVNYEDLRSYYLEENQKFLDAIKRGELPLELEERAEDEELEVNVEDMKDEVYVPKKKAFHPFTGRGYRLGRISDVQDFVEQAQRTNAPFILTTSLPFRELRDEGQSLEGADLSNAVIVQRPINSQAPFGHS